MRKYFLLTTFILQVSLLCSQDLRLPKVFGDHMILQRESPVRVWGWSSPGKELSVTIDGQSVTTQAGEDGKWECMLPAHSAGGPYELIISGDKKVQFEDVWFGDVWIAGGQSNMAWNLKSEVDNWQEEVVDSDYPQIRFFTVPYHIIYTRWWPCPSQNVGKTYKSFSMSYYLWDQNDIDCTKCYFLQ